MVPLIGIIDVAVGSKDHYVSSNRFKNNDIAIESAEAELRYHKLKVMFGAIRMVTFGMTYGIIAEASKKPLELESLLQLDAISSGLIACFAIGHVMNGFYSLYKGFMKEEAINEKRFQGDILKDNEIFNKILNKTELSVNDSYSLFLKGNKLANDIPIPEMIKKMKEQIIEFKNKWSTEYYDHFKVLTKEVLKALNENKKIEKALEYPKKITNELLSFFKKNEKVINLVENIKNYSTKITDNRLLSEATKELIKNHSNYNKDENELFREYIRTSNQFKASQSNITVWNQELKNINKEAIIQSYEFMRKQNLELFFAKIVLDYNKGIIHKNIINQFSVLHNNTKLPEKDGRAEVAIDSYKNISQIAIRMKNNQNVYSKNTDIKVILNHINPNLVSNKKIKIYSFDNVFEMQKEKIIKKHLEFSNVNNIKNKKNVFDEFEIDNKSFNEIVKITEKKLNQEKKMAEKIKDAKKNKI